jgi:hypothetical protein
VPRLYIPPGMRASLSAQRARAMKPVTFLSRPATIGQEQYTQRVRGPLQGGYGTALVSGTGAATVTVGPTGVGTKWYVQQIGINTSVGPNDASTCAIYWGPMALLTLIGSQSYAGGGDSIGGTWTLDPGYFIVAVWAGGTAGSLAALTVSGLQDQLVVPSPVWGRG